MIVHLSKQTSQRQTQEVLNKLANLQLPVFPVGRPCAKIVVNKEVNKNLQEKIAKMSHVTKIADTNGKRYKLTSRDAKAENTIVNIGKIKIGGKTIVVMAGPCSVENKAQITNIAKAIKSVGCLILRGGAYKPRTAPYDFQGLEKAGLLFLKHAAKKSDVKIITEVLDPRDVEMIASISDCLQIGARNMQNYALLKEVGKLKIPVLLKRGMWANYKEFLLAAEYIMAGGNTNVILCERGIRTHVPELRFTLDLNAVPFLKRESHLPIIVDPSHGTGRRDLVAPMAKAAIAAGADGLLIETHSAPEKSISDADQTISLDDFRQLIKELKVLVKAVGRTL